MKEKHKRIDSFHQFVLIHGETKCFVRFKKESEGKENKKKTSKRKEKE